MKSILKNGCSDMAEHLNAKTEYWGKAGVLYVVRFTADPTLYKIGTTSNFVKRMDNIRLWWEKQGVITGIEIIALVPYATMAEANIAEAQMRFRNLQRGYTLYGNDYFSM